MNKNFLFSKSKISLKEIYYFRSKVYERIRKFFHKKNFLEVETPILSSNLIPEMSIEIFETKHIHPDKGASSLYLVPSPEIFMKKLLSYDLGSLYQISKSFRNSESISPFHNPEFSMLEWYFVNKGYKDNIRITQDLLRELAEFSSKSFQCYMAKDPYIITMREAFLERVGIDLHRVKVFEDLQKAASCVGLSDFVKRSSNFEELFNFIFVNNVEPYLPSHEAPVYLIDYPVQITTTAKQKTNEPYYERWELYMKGLEIANCFSEETESDKIKELFEREGKIKEIQSLVPHLIDSEYYKYFQDSRFPECSGVALGIDRLIMILTESQDISQILPFSLFGHEKDES